MFPLFQPPPHCQIGPYQESVWGAGQRELMGLLQVWPSTGDFVSIEANLYAQTPAAKIGLYCNVFYNFYVAPLSWDGRNLSPSIFWIFPAAYPGIYMTHGVWGSPFGLELCSTEERQMDSRLGPYGSPCGDMGSASLSMVPPL